jgi:hypothetical protein
MIADAYRYFGAALRHPNGWGALTPPDGWTISPRAWEDLKRQVPVVTSESAPFSGIEMRVCPMMPDDLALVVERGVTRVLRLR